MRDRIKARNDLLSLHFDMLMEADSRGEPIDLAQLDLLYSEMAFLADLTRTIAAARLVDALEFAVAQ
jgi:hypothetical protein